MGDIQDLAWKDAERNMGIPLHGICSYMAMFPPALPHEFIQEYTERGDVVLDPFSGRGTTVLQACLLERKGVANDLNPLAFLLSKAKVHVPSKQALLDRLSELEKEFRSTDVRPRGVNRDIRMLYHPSTTKQLFFLRENLDWRNDAKDAFIMATLVGIAHGKSKNYLSLSMPNTFSMSPNYIRKYVAEHGLKRPKRDAFKLLRRRVEHVHVKVPTRGEAHYGDATNLETVGDESVDLVMTSPPYTNVIRYGYFNWIRLWLLGRQGREVDQDLMITQSLTKYQEFMSKVMGEVKRVLKPGKRAVFVIGDVRDRSSKEVTNLAQFVWENCAEPAGLSLAEPIIEDRIRDDKKVSKIWGEQKKGKATKIDRILVLQKP